MFKEDQFPQAGLKIVKKLHQQGYQTYFVGGCLRDLLLGLKPGEWDITTNAKPQEMAKLFEKVVPTGLEYGTVTIILEDNHFEVTTFRSDQRYVDGRHPENVVFCDDLHKDLSRRDFTINALAYDPLNHDFVDDFNGQADLNNKLIRAIGNPLDRFSEDGLRPIRACRFAAKLGFTVEAKTFAAINQTLEISKKVALERVHDEIVKLLSTDKPSIGFELMRQSGLLNLFIPELNACFGIGQPENFHQYDVFWHSLHACDAAPKDNIIVRLAALFHDIEKPSCKKADTFYGHDQTGATTTEIILKRLKFSCADIKAVCNLVGQHMFNYTSGWTDAAVRRFIRRIGGAENVADLFALRLADTKAMKQAVGSAYLQELKGRIDKIVAEQNALHLSDLKVNGQDVMAALNLSAGPKVGEVLNALLEKVLDDPGLNNHATLTNLIKDLYA